jgi:hypothetical protein
LQGGEPPEIGAANAAPIFITSVTAEHGYSERIFAINRSMKKLPYIEGDIFALPLEQGGYALGVVARASKLGKTLLGYFFARCLESVPRSEDVQDLLPGSAIWKVRFGDLYLMSGRWPIVGHVGNWHRIEWPMPKFLRTDPLTGRAKVISYKDDDPNRSCREEAVHGDYSGLERDGTYGAGVVEHHMSKLIGVPEVSKDA